MIIITITESAWKVSYVDGVMRWMVLLLLLIIPRDGSDWVVTIDDCKNCPKLRSTDRIFDWHGKAFRTRHEARMIPEIEFRIGVWVGEGSRCKHLLLFDRRSETQAEENKLIFWRLFRVGFMATPPAQSRPHILKEDLSFRYSFVEAPCLPQNPVGSQPSWTFQMANLIVVCRSLILLLHKNGDISFFRITSGPWRRMARMSGYGAIKSGGVDNDKN